MKIFKRLLGRINAAANHFSKKAYTKGLVIVTGGIVTILLLGSNGFFVNAMGIRQNEPTNEKEQLAELEDLSPVNITAVGTIDAQEKDGSQSESSLNEILDFQIQKIQEIQEFQLMISSMMRDDELSKPTVATPAVSNSLVNYSSEDYQTLLDIVEAEATGQDVIGKIMVANVILNRVESDRFPDTIQEVVYQTLDGRAQFSPVANGRMGSLPLAETTYEAVDRALAGEDYSEGAFFFVAPKYASEKAVSWFENNLLKVTEFGGHDFYAFKN